MGMHLGEAQIQEGALGSDVRRIQEVLTGQGYNTGGIDGIWGAQTTQAIKSFQSSKGLIPDGIAGPLTWAALNGQLQPVPAPEIPQKQIEVAQPMGGLLRYALYGIGGLVALSLFVRKRG